MRKFRISVLALTAATVAVTTLGGCASEHEPLATTPITGVTPSGSASLATGNQPAPLTPEAASQDAIAAYLGMQRAFLKAGETADPAYPDLAKHATGTALQRLTGALKSMQDQGLRGRGDSVFYPQIESLSPPAAPTKAQIRDCMDTSKTEVFKANGETYQDEPGGWRLVIADVEATNRVWKVTDFTIRKVGSCRR